MGGTISCFEPGYSAALFQAAVDGDLDAVEQSVRKNPELLMAKGVGMQVSCSLPHEINRFKQEVDSPITHGP